MFQEFVDKERFQRAAWDLLIPAQHDAIRSGEWDKYLKRDTGHKRLFSADKQVTRVFGKPQDSAQFDAAVDKWKNLWQPMWDRYQAASLFQCQREFAMDRADESFAIYSWSEYATEFRDFVTTECDAIREIIQTGYSIDDDLLSKSEALHEKLRADMLKKYRPEQDDFLRSLGTLD